MHKKRAERILKALEALGAEQMLITDPMSIYYLTDVYVQDGHHCAVSGCLQTSRSG